MSPWVDQLVTPWSRDDDPLDLATVRDDHLRVVNGNVEDDYIRSLMDASIEMVHQHTERSMLPQTFAHVGPCFAACIKLPHPPLIEVVSIQYYDADGDLQTLSASVYDVVKPSGPTAGYGEVRLAADQEWPDIDERPDAVTITYRAGYVTATSPEEVSVPTLITQARLLMIKELYEQRGDSVRGQGETSTPAEITSIKLLDRYRVY